MPDQIKLRDFESQILYFNGMYRLPLATYPSTHAVITSEKERTIIKGDKNALGHRLEGFKKTLLDEIEEIEDIKLSLSLGFKYKDGACIEPPVLYTEIEFLVDMADWLGDIQVYCASEMAKFGIPLKETLSIIMSSNFSKQGADGNPIYDSNGKVLKGPAYWKPEPRIKQMLEEYIADAVSDKEVRPYGIVWRE